MIDVNFSNGNSYTLKNAWEDLNPTEYLTVLDYIVLFMSGKLSIEELRQMVFFLVSGIRPCLHPDKQKAAQQAENVYRIAQMLTFMVRIEYENHKSFSRLKKEIRDKLTRYLPEELDQDPEVRWATKAKKEITPDLVFAKNLIPQIGRRRHILKGYSFEVSDQILVTSLSTSQFIDAQTVAQEIQETGKESLLNLLTAILYCNDQYDSQKAAMTAKTLDWLDLRTKKGVFINFNAIQAFLFTRTKYSLLFNEPAPAKKSKIDLGLGSAAHSLIKSGYGDIENSNLVKFFEVMYSELVSGVITLHRQGLALDKITEASGLSIAKINQII
ncbi:MAG: hypothetical protein AB2L24_21865 [Mangrovibacterium sp.]